MTSRPTPPSLRDIARHAGVSVNTVSRALTGKPDVNEATRARVQELAKELGYTGDTNDSASMNVWLHKQVMSKLAANGGKLPPEIKH